MKKILLCCFLAVALTACSSGTGSYPWKVSKSSLQSVKEVFAECMVVDGTLSAAGMRVRITNKGDTRVFFGREYRLQILTGKNWYDISVSQDFTMEQLYLDPGGVFTEQIGWEKAYGNLPSGTYRFCRESSAGWMTCEFTV